MEMVSTLYAKPMDAAVNEYLPCCIDDSKYYVLRRLLGTRGKVSGVLRNLLVSKALNSMFSDFSQ